MKEWHVLVYKNSAVIRKYKNRAVNLNIFICIGLALCTLLLEGDAVVEGLRAIAALGDEVEANTTDVFLGTEVLEVVYLVALYLEFHQAPVAQTDTVALAQMAVDDIRKPYDGGGHHALADRVLLAGFLDELA